MAKAKTQVAGQDVSALKAELALLKREVAALKRQLASAGKGGVDPRVDKLIEALKKESPRFKKCLESASL